MNEKNEPIDAAEKALMSLEEQLEIADAVDARLIKHIKEQAIEAAKVLPKYEIRFARIEADLFVLKWMMGINVVLSFAIALKLIL